MNFGKRTDAAESGRIVARALERGLTFFDTANAYNEGESERILGQALKKVRESCIVATKVGFGRVNGKPEGLSRARILSAVDESLARLGTDYVDLYYLHAPDVTVPIEESVGAMQALLEAGKIRRWAVSNYASWQILEMNHIADARKMWRLSRRGGQTRFGGDIRPIHGGSVVLRRDGLGWLQSLDQTLHQSLAIRIHHGGLVIVQQVQQRVVVASQ